MGKERVEQALRASRVLTREQGFLQLGEDPDHTLSSDRVDERLHATLELSDVDRAGVDLRGGRLEHDRVFVDAIERCPCQRGLPHAVLADEEDGSRRALFERGDDDLDELSSTPGEERGRIVERSLPDPPDVPQVRQRAPGLEAPAEVGSEVHLESVDERLEVVGRLERDLVERVDVDLLAAADAFSDELRDDLVPKRLEGLVARLR